MSKKGFAIGVAAGVAILGLAGAAAAGVYALLQDHLREDKKDEEEERGHSHSHGHSHGHGHSHSHGHGHGRSCAVSFADAEAYAARMETPERDHYQQPSKVIDEVIRPLLDTVAGKSVIADIGAGTGYFSAHLARAFPDATKVEIIATDPEPAMREYCSKRLADQGASNVIVADAGSKHAGLPKRANVLLLVNVYHHLDNAIRVDWLRNSAMLDLQNDGSPTYLVVVEWKPGKTPAIGASTGPPDWMRMDRSAVIEEAASAGFDLVSAPALGEPFDEVFYVLTFSGPSAAAAPGAAASASAGAQ